MGEQADESNGWWMGGRVDRRTDGRAHEQAGGQSDSLRTPVNKMAIYEYICIYVYQKRYDEYKYIYTKWLVSLG